jgi:opacity protein-like surface antigen
MKRILVLMLIAIASNIFPQHGAAAIKLGHFSPSASDGGFIIGYEGSHFVDERIMFGWSIDWFHKNYVDKKLVSQFNQAGIGGVSNELRAKTNLHDFPLMINLSVKFPVGPLFDVYGTGGIGAEILLINYRNYQNPDEDEFKAAFDFNWRLGAGLLYIVGRRSEVFVELGYHSSKPSWEYEVTDTFGTKRTFEREYDMSGVMARLGFRFYY